ncbi:MAG: xanthine dehydrogenase family protein molybdopterin-binding subunit [bacterium]
MTPRLDALDKACGATLYAADVALPGMCYAALVRSPLPHARITRVDVAGARSLPGVVGVFTGNDLPHVTFGRRVRDIPVLAWDRVRFIGERVAAVVAETRDLAEEAAFRVDVEYEELPAVLTAAEALAPDAPAIHDAPWRFPGAVVTSADAANLQSRARSGDPDRTDELLARSAHVVDRTYTTPTGHAGYLEPQACVASVHGDGSVHVWASDKGPYRVREALAECLQLDQSAIVVHPVAIGGDFGGKGLIGEIPLCVELARLTRRPVKLALRYTEDLTATNPRHPTTLRVRVGADGNGRLQALRLDALADGGAYAGFKPRAGVDLHGMVDAGSPYRIPAAFTETRIAYTNTVPRGHMRAPGAPQTTFAVESALDELALEVGVPCVELRRRNLLRDGDSNVHGVMWAECRGVETLQAALEAASPACAAPAGWLTGTGVGVYDRRTNRAVRTSLRLAAEADGGIRAEVPVPETGTGSHTVLRRILAGGLGVPVEQIRVVHVPTDDLPYDRGAGGSRVSVGLGSAATAAIKAWADRGDRDAVMVEVDEDVGADATSYCVQVADVAVDPATGTVRVLRIVTAVDVAEVLNPVAHGMQLDGGTAMGYGFACLEDLHVEDGQVWSGTLGEFKLPSIRDLPPLRNVLVPGGRGVGPLNIKSAGELTNVPTAAAIANAVADATGVRLDSLPVRAEVVWTKLAEEQR